jgi:PKD repeat protein
MTVLDYPAGSTQTVATVSLGACYGAGSTFNGAGSLSISQSAPGHSKNFNTYVLDAPYAGSVAGAVFSSFTQALSTDSTGGNESRGINNGLPDWYGTLTQTTDTLYLVVAPNYVATDWYLDNGAGTSLTAVHLTGATVSCGGGGGTPPVADFVGTPLTGNPTLAVTFTDLSSNTPTSWAWTFGDGGTSTSQNPSHNYTAAGTYTVALTATNADGSDTLTRVAYVVVTDPPPDPVPGGHVEFDDEWIEITPMEWTITRGASAELTGGSSPGSATIVLKNASDEYNPENASGPYYGFLHDGPRVWIGVNEDGTVTPDALKTVYGLFAGRITDLSPMPVGAATVAPTVELVCEDPLGWYGRAKVTVADDTTRSQYQLRQAVLDVIDDFGLRSLESEPATLPLSSADGLGLNVLDAINAANGTRHFAKPADNFTDWFAYTTVRRTSRLDGTAEATADAAAEHITGTSGWRVSADGVINQQKASVDPITFPVRRLVWQQDTLPLTVVSGTPQVIWADFGDYVADPIVDTAHTGSSLTAVLTPFGHTAKLTLTSSGTSVVTLLNIEGNLVERGSTESVVIDDLTSQSLARGIRAGPDLSGDYLGTITSAKGFAQHIVWRFGNALYRPTMTVLNWMPEMFDLDLCDRISLSIAELSITDRIFDIVGLTLHSDLAALADDGVTPVVLHDATYVLQESRVQTPTTWFTWDVSDWDDSASPWAY